MKTWGHPNIGINVCDEIKRKDNDTEWIVTKIDYPPDKPGKIFINAITRNGDTMQCIFNPDEWLKSGINYLQAFISLQIRLELIEEEHMKFFGE